MQPSPRLPLRMIGILFFAISAISLLAPVGSAAPLKKASWQTDITLTAPPDPLPTDTETPSPLLTQTSPLTPTLTATPTPTATIIISPTYETPFTPTATPTATLLSVAPASTEIYSATAITYTLEPTATLLVFLPITLQRPVPTYVPPVKVLYCKSPSATIPDNTPSGVDSTITIADERLITDLDVLVNVNHTWVGDVKVKLTHHESDRTITLIDRPGYPASQYGCSYDNIRAILDDEISSSVANKCASDPAAISGIYIPEVPLAAFDNQSINGNWTLNVSDRAVNDSGRFNEWCLMASISPAPPPPTPTTEPPSFPSQAIINNVTGRDQSLPLDCESRSAVDWANYFGRRIGEIEFFNNLPESDNPDKGFVGDVYGQWGQIPPNPYGVHAEPVAALLREYGLQAYAHRPLSWDGLRAEIAAGRPVIVWIIGSVVNGIPVYYTPSDGLSTVVARYEHTVIVTGYTQSLVYYLNGDTIYTKSVAQFLDSWSALGNMAITARP